MKSSYATQIKRTATRRGSAKRIAAGLAMALVLGIPHQEADAAVLAVDLNTAADFAVLAGAGITVAAPVNSTVIIGDIGTHATTTITGLENLILFGVNHVGGDVTQQAKIELGGAYTDAAGRPTDVLFPLIHDIGGAILEPGVYKAPSSLGIDGVVTLDADGDPNAVWIFQIGSTLITSSGSSVNLINGAQAGNIFWQVGSSATLGTGSQFEGTIMAQESITVTTNAILIGRALAISGAVTLDNNNITIPEASSSVLLVFGLSIAAMVRRRRV